MNEAQIQTCLVCGKPLPDSEDVVICTRCGFQHLPGLGDDQESIRQMQMPLATNFRSKTFLPKFDLGVTCYYWKDNGGTIGLDTTKRLSFGTAAALEKGPIWLEQEFARLPDEGQLTIEVSVQQSGAQERRIEFQVPALSEPLLQRLGLTMTKDLRLELMLKNDKTSVTSAPVAFLPD